MFSSYYFCPWKIIPVRLNCCTMIIKLMETILSIIWNYIIFKLILRKMCNHWYEVYSALYGSMVVLSKLTTDIHSLRALCIFIVLCTEMWTSQCRKPICIYVVFFSVMKVRTFDTGWWLIRNMTIWVLEVKSTDLW